MEFRLRSLMKMVNSRMPIRTIRGQTLRWWRLDAALLRFRLDRETCCLPSIPTSDEGTCSGPPRLSELLRHTGASGFLRSGTVCYQPGIAWQIELRRAFGYVIGWEPHRSVRLGRARVVRPIGADVKEHYWHSGIP